MGDHGLDTQAHTVHPSSRISFHLLAVNEVWVAFHREFNCWCYGKFPKNTHQGVRWYQIGSASPNKNGSDVGEIGRSCSGLSATGSEVFVDQVFTVGPGRERAVIASPNTKRDMKIDTKFLGCFGGH
jgi:hypothetical protein